MRRKKTGRLLAKTAVTQDNALVCAACGENLAQIDIEHFHRCPYCDVRIERDSELEDFLMRPIVDHWVSMYQHPPVRGEDGFKSISIM